MEKMIFGAWRKIGEKVGKDRKGREGRRNQAVQIEREQEGALTNSLCGKNGKVRWSQDY